ncbi:MAG: branched-chain amino acid ABC transporter permease [Oscillospiraceae bacterium]
MTFLTQILNGLQIGSIYALVALGYSMVYGIIKLINFAHGDIIMVGSYLAWYIIARMGVSSPIAIAAAILGCALLGMTIEKVAYTPLRGSPRISLLITAIGISYLLQNLAQLIFTANPRMFTNLFPGTVSIGSLRLSMVTVITIAVSVVIMVCLTLLVNMTKIGKAMRAVSEDTDAARLMGINVNSTISFTFGLGSALAAIASVLYCCSYSMIDPTMGSMFGLKAFVASVLGGIGSMPGAMLGGLVIGVAESLTNGYINSSYSDAIVFGILIVVLLVKPTGFMGRTMNEKV